MFSGFTSKITWQGVAVGVVGTFIVAHLLYRR